MQAISKAKACHPVLTTWEFLQDSVTPKFKLWFFDLETELHSCNGMSPNLSFAILINPRPPPDLGQPVFCNKPPALPVHHSQLP